MNTFFKIMEVLGHIIFFAVLASVGYMIWWGLHSKGGLAPGDYLFFVYVLYVTNPFLRMPCDYNSYGSWLRDYRNWHRK